MLHSTSPRVNIFDRIKPTRAKRSDKVSATAELDILVKSLFLDGEGPQETPPSLWEEMEDEALLHWAESGEEPQVTAPEVEINLSEV